MTILLPPLLLLGCGDGDMCGNRVVSRATSPTGALEAVVFERDCGATTAFSTQVSLVQPGEMPVGAGRLFVASRGVRHAEWGNVEAAARWLGPDRLEIRVDGASEIFHEQQYLDGVAIVYRQVPSPSLFKQPLLAPDQIIPASGLDGSAYLRMPMRPAR